MVDDKLNRCSERLACHIAKHSLRQDLSVQEIELLARAVHHLSEREWKIEAEGWHHRCNRLQEQIDESEARAAAIASGKVTELHKQ